MKHCVVCMYQLVFLVCPTRWVSDGEGEGTHANIIDNKGCNVNSCVTTIVPAWDPEGI